MCPGGPGNHRHRVPVVHGRFVGLLAATDGPAPLQLVEPEENQTLSGRLTLELSVTAPRERRARPEAGPS
jgi:hypothetical protein